MDRSDTGPERTEAAPITAARPAAELPAAARPRPEPPRFDVARVGNRGALVTAGRAAPGAEVILLENGREIGRGRADSRGEWVILPETPLAPGARELTLLMRLPGGEPQPGEASVVLLVPNTALVMTAEARPSATDALPEPADAPLALLLHAPGVEAPIRVLQAPAGARLSLDLVDYAGSAGMRFAGAAPPGARLRLYIDEAPTGEVVADGQGRWSHSPAPQPSVGRHTLRADQIGPQGQVLARVEQPFQRDPPSAVLESATEARHIVQPGHNLWRIARGTYGEGVRYTLIFAANRDQIRNANLIYPGQVFTLPQPEAPAASSRSR
ncbi:MAG: peptidoglycan-binding protein [Rubritepida sp.]|nr:peptidoglycan-binding protein [Rubritepida sp.]